MFRKILSVNGLAAPWKRFSSSTPTPLASLESLQGRDLASTETYITSDLHNLLWSAIDLKAKKDPQQNICNGKSVCVISEHPIRSISVANACVRIGASTGFLKPSDLLGEVDFEILGKTVGSSADIVFIDSDKINQAQIETFATGCTSPVICGESSQLSLISCLSDFMTLYEHYKYLRRLTISFIGTGEEPLLNSYALLLPKLGMHLHLLINGKMESAVWDKAIGLFAQHQCEFKQHDNLDENLYRTHVVSTGPHGIKDWTVSLKDTEEMDLDWTVLHSNVHQGVSVEKELLRCKQSLIWKSIANQTWIYQALIATKTAGYKPTGNRPNFEGAP